MGRMIGIDLGTTNSCVCVIDHDEHVVIPNAEGARTTPSMVAFTESGERLVGQIAKRQSVTNPTNTIYAVKRLIGRGFDSPEVSAFRKTTPYKIVKGPGDRAVIEAGGKNIEPVEISAMVLAKMKEIAQDYLNAEVTDAVVTVPAYFNDSQRQSTKDAGRIAGLNVQRIINEPTAAALAYGLGSAVHETVAVFDLGGGTFDVSILEIGDGVFQVKSTHGDTYLGGEDWDRRIVDHLADEFMKENKVDLRGDPMALQRLKEASEKAKHELSTTTETDINLPFITADASGPKHLSTSINRATLEAITADLIERLEAPCREAMADAGLKPENIDKVLLVGGMTRMPKVQEKVASIFGKKPAKGVNPDEVVAIGAAIQGSVLEGETEDVVLLDVTPLSLGIETMGGIFTRLIDRNTSIPVKRSEVFSTTQDNQSVVNVHVLQGERELAQDNMSLSRFQLVGLPPAPRGVPQIEVTFSIDANGIVHVSAKDLGTGKEQTVRIQVSSGLNEEAVNRMIAEGDTYKEEDRKRKALVQMRNDAEGLLYTTRKALEEFGTSLTLDQKDEASALADNLEKSLDTENIDQIKKAFEKLSTASQKLTQAIYQQSSK